MFESCRAHFRVAGARSEHGVVRHFDAYVAERDAVRGARDLSDDLSVERQLVARLRAAVELEDAQATVDLPAVVLPRDRLLARIATLREADVRLVEPRLRGQDRVVELMAPAWDAGLDPPAFDVFFARLVALRSRVEHLVA